MAEPRAAGRDEAETCGAQMAAQRPDWTARLFESVNRLRRFTTAELAANADLEMAVAEAFVATHPDLLEPVPSAEGSWRVRASAARALAGRVAELRRTGSDAGAIVTPKPDILALVELTLDALERGRPPKPELRNHEIELAGLQILAREAALRERRADLEKATQRIEAARRRLDAARAALRAAPAAHVAVRDEEPAATASERLRLHALLLDWTARWDAGTAVATTPPSNVMDLAPASELIATLLRARASLGRTEPHAELAPAVLLLRWRDAATAAQLATLRQDLAARLDGLLRGAPGDELPALAAMAVALDATNAAGTIFRALILPHLSAGLAPAARMVCLASLARLARPRPDGDHDRASANACHFLCVQRGIPDGELAVLVPAALGALDVDAQALLLRLARTAFGSDGRLRHFAEGPSEGALARNLSLALQRSNYVVLQQHIASLVELDDGRGLVAMLNRGEHAALELRDAEDGQYVVRMGRRVAQYLGASQQRSGVLIAVDEKSQAGKALQKMMLLRSWDSAQRSDPDEGAEIFSFSAAMERKKRAGSRSGP
jgi:hypothetical protein